MQLNKPNNIIENITILYSLSAILMIFLDINNYKLAIDKDNVDYNLVLVFKTFLNLGILFIFLIEGYNIINLKFYKKHLFYYLLLSIIQFIKSIYLFNIYYYYQQLNISILFSIFSLIINIISIIIIIRYKKIIG